MYKSEVSTVYGLSHTGMTMHQRFGLLAKLPAKWRGKRYPYTKTRSQTIDQNLIMAIVHQLENQGQRPFRDFSARGRSRGRGRFQRAVSEGSVRGFPGLRRSNSFGNISLVKNNSNWRRSNGNLSVNGSVYSDAGSELSWGSLRSRQSQRGVWGRGRGRRHRGRARGGRVTPVTETAGAAGARGGGRPARGVGRGGLRRSTAGAEPQVAPALGSAPQYQRGRGWGRGSMSRNQPPKPVPTKEELDAEIDHYMAGSKLALDQQIDEYMRQPLDFF